MANKKACDLRLNDKFFYIEKVEMPEYSSIPGLKEIPYYAKNDKAVRSLNMVVDNPGDPEILINDKYKIPFKEVPGDKSTRDIFVDEKECDYVAALANEKSLNTLKSILEPATEYKKMLEKLANKL